MADYLFDEGGYLYDEEDYSEYFGVGGPGDGFTSSGPGGMSSAQAQAKAGPSDEALQTAQGGAAAAAADAVIANMFDDQGQFQHGEEVIPTGGGGGGGGPISSGPIPGGSAPLSSGGSKFSLPLIIGAVVGVAFFFLKK